MEVLKDNNIQNGIEETLNRARNIRKPVLFSYYHLSRNNLSIKNDPQTKVTPMNANSIEVLKLPVFPLV